MVGALGRLWGALPQNDHTMPPLSCIRIPHLCAAGRWQGVTSLQLAGVGRSGWHPGQELWQSQALVSPAGFVNILSFPTDV